jgi:hypothetical protein
MVKGRGSRVGARLSAAEAEDVQLSIVHRERYGKAYETERGLFRSGPITKLSDVSLNEQEHQRLLTWCLPKTTPLSMRYCIKDLEIISFIRI